MKRNFFKKATGFFLIIYLISVFIPSVRCFAESEGYEGAISYRENIEIGSRFGELIFGKNKDSEIKNKEISNKENEIRLIPGGDVFGIKIDEPYLTVKESGESTALHSGDRIISLGGIKTEDPEDITRALDSSGGKPIVAEIIRGNDKLTLTLTPKYEGGHYRLGVTLRTGTMGIGTFTYIDPKSKEFGGLGHGVYSSEGKFLCEIENGDITEVVLGSLKRGEAGKPGELSGVLTDKVCGKLYENDERGVFGELSECDYKESDAIPIGRRWELKCGKAEIISTLKSGKKMTFEIEITDIDRNAEGSKCFKIKATDPALIAISGGIVRGMSGSPIIQNGKLVGAVTHVMVADPTEGYGIFIENMLNAAQMPMAKAS